MERLLMIEDDPRQGSVLQRGLREEGYEVRWCRTSLDGLQALTSGRFALVLLDLNLPDGDGLRLLRRMRSRGDDTPVLLLTARDGVTHRVQGLDAGADDYVEKPFSFEELLARIRAQLRRDRGSRVVIGSAELDRVQRVIVRDGASFELSRREFELLGFLIVQRGEVVTREQILEQAWSLYGEPNLVDVQISRLRQKLDAVDAVDSVIETVRGEGYRLRPQERR